MRRGWGNNVKISKTFVALTAILFLISIVITYGISPVGSDVWKTYKTVKQENDFYPLIKIADLGKDGDVETVDLDGDGVKEIVVVDGSSKTLRIFNRLKETEYELNKKIYAFNLAFGDVNGDGIKDIVLEKMSLSDEYEVVVDKKGDSDQIRLKVELLPGAQSQRQEIDGQLTDQLRLKTNLRYDIEYFDFGALPRYDVKAQRFKDLRKKG
jgi:hypothetical protein